MSTIILAGGLSTRMRRDKATLVLDGLTLPALLAGRFSGYFGNIIIVARLDQELEVGDEEIVHDIYENSGPLGGIHAGLLASPDDVNIIIACDMPFADPALARHLVSRMGDHDAVVPLLDRGPEPLFAVYRKSVLARVVNNLKNRSLKLKTLLDSVDTLYVPEDDMRRVDSDLRSFLNVNTPEDYDKLTRLL